MARKKKKAGKNRRRGPVGWYADLDSDQRRMLLRRCAWATFVLALVAGLGVIHSRLEAHVESRLIDRVTEPKMVYEDLPASMESLALPDMTTALSEIAFEHWLDVDLCRKMAERLSGVAWIEKIVSVRRRSDGHFVVRADYRVPEAMVRWGEDYFLVDATGARLPGRYIPSDQWKVVSGVEQSVPAPGQAWMGEDLKSGLRLLQGLHREPFANQVRGIDISNFGGRSASAASHMVLVTMREGGRILWGSAPGYELVENTVKQKLAILRENHRRTGWLDAGNRVIDISTYPDRFTIPG